MKRLSLILLLWVPILTLGQNLVPNNSFETYTAPPNAFGLITNATPWYSNNGSSDLFNIAATSGGTVPSNYFGTQMPHTGNGYAGIAASQANTYHEYIGVQLTSPLTVGQAYYYEVYVSAGEGPYRYGVNNFGMKFTIGQAIASVGDPPISGPTVNHTSVIMDYTNWVQISGTFSPTIAANHVSIGNFFSSAATTWSLLGTAATINSYYWFIDDVVVQPSVIFDLQDHVFEGQVLSSQRIKLNWRTQNTEGTKSYSIRRSLDGGETWEEIGQQPASANVHEYAQMDMPGMWDREVMYRLKLIREDGTVSYSNVLNFQMPKPSLENTFSLHPNPVAAGQTLSMNFAAAQQGTASWEIFDLKGAKVASGTKELEVGNAGIVVETDDFAPGQYFVRLQMGAEVVVKKLAVAK